MARYLVEVATALLYGIVCVLTWKFAGPEWALGLVAGWLGIITERQIQAEPESASTTKDSQPMT